MPVDDLKKGIDSEKFIPRKYKVEQALRNYLKIFDAAPNCPEIARLSKDNETSNVLINWITPGPQAQKDAYGYICEIAYLLSHLRTQVSIYTNKRRKTDEDTTEDSIDFTVDKPQIENPTRARDPLVNAAEAHAISQGRDTFDNRDVPITIKLGLSTTTKERSELIRELINAGGQLTTQEICNKLNFSKATAIKHIREFKTTGVISLSEGSPHKSISITLKDEFNWFLSDIYKDILRTETAQNEEIIEKEDEND
jgi:predicted transcriptional regulator